MTFRYSLVVLARDKPCPDPPEPAIYEFATHDRKKLFITRQKLGLKD